jgi:hypothetical protein
MKMLRPIFLSGVTDKHNLKDCLTEDSVSETPVSSKILTRHIFGYILSFLHLVRAVFEINFAK